MSELPSPALTCLFVGGSACEEMQANRSSAGMQAGYASGHSVAHQTGQHTLSYQHNQLGSAITVCMQADRIANILKGQPVKKGLKVTHVPPPPVSMFLTETWQPSAAAAAGSSSPASTAADRAKWVSQKDFDAVNNKQRSAVAKPGFSDATTAALHE